jgi:hypothetical protein
MTEEPDWTRGNRSSNPSLPIKTVSSLLMTDYRGKVLCLFDVDGTLSKSRNVCYLDVRPIYFVFGL